MGSWNSEDFWFTQTGFHKVKYKWGEKEKKKVSSEKKSQDLSGSQVTNRSQQYFPFDTFPVEIFLCSQKELQHV